MVQFISLSMINIQWLRNVCLPKVKFRFARNCQPSNDNVNTPNQTQSELRKQVETSLNKKILHHYWSVLCCGCKCCIWSIFPRIEKANVWNWCHSALSTCLLPHNKFQLSLVSQRSLAHTTTKKNGVSLFRLWSGGQTEYPNIDRMSRKVENLATPFYFEKHEYC